MNRFDDLLPEERVPEHEELITLLEHAYRAPISLSSTEEDKVIERVRERLLRMGLEDSPQVGVLNSTQHKAVLPATKSHLKGRRFRLILLLAAALVIATLLITPLLVLRLMLPSISNHLTVTNQVHATKSANPIPTVKVTAQSYDNFVAANGIMYGFDAQQTRVNPYERILNPTTVGGLKKKWAYDMRISVNSSPTVARGVVYIGCVCGYVYALDAVTGAKKWAYPTGSQVASSAAVVDGIVYIGSYEGHTLYALDAATGSMKWAYRTFGSIASSPAVSGGVVYVGSFDGNVYALDAATGAKKWVIPINGDMSSDPILAGDLLYFGSRHGTLNALDVTSGTIKWAYQDGGTIDSAPFVANGMVYFGSLNGNLYAFDLPGT